LEEKILFLKNAISTYLPPAHYQSLNYLVSHLYRVSQQSSQNLMSAYNLSTVFCPTLMRTPNISLKSFQLTTWQQEIQVLELIIQYHSKLFK